MKWEVRELREMLYACEGLKVGYWLDWRVNGH